MAEQSETEEGIAGGKFSGEHAAGLADRPVSDPLDPSELGVAEIEPKGALEAGSYATLKLTYNAGKFGIDDSGSLRICFRFASDQGVPQFDSPEAENYTTVESSNGARLQIRYDPKGNVRPWDKTIYIKVISGFLKQGDTITIVLGARQHGSPGFRLQTFCEESFEIRVLVDPIATFNYQPLPQQPKIALVPGPAERYVVIVPSKVGVGEAFRLHLRAEDRWGNPTDRCGDEFDLLSNVSIQGLPAALVHKGETRATEIGGLSINQPGDVAISLKSRRDGRLFNANPLQVVTDETDRAFWADMHGQSEETIGTGSARDYFQFARDLAAVDIAGHQGNDFQISEEFWAELNQLTAEFNQPGRFVTLPGYEWSGNTGLGGDRNIFFPEEGRTIRRSSHALLPDRSDLGTDCHSVGELFDTLAVAGEFDVVTIAHCGGRYADIGMAHDGRFERSVEVHSSWGTFEWLLEDALRLGHRVGIVANSDGHKGRPGASYPGASMFGAIGGLTCLLVPELTREAVFGALRRRHHYATTGGPGGRPIIDVAVLLSEAGTVYHDDPKIFDTVGIGTTKAMMGDIVHLPKGTAELEASILSSVPIERIDLFVGSRHSETIRPHPADTPDARLRIIWEGAADRGRARQVHWDGSAWIEGNIIQSAKPINFFNPDNRFDVDRHCIRWQSLTTGNIGGLDLWLADRASGTLRIETDLISGTLPIAAISREDTRFLAAMKLPCSIRICRLPESNDVRSFAFRRPIPVAPAGDTSVYLRATFEDGTVAWTSPTYLFR